MRDRLIKLISNADCDDNLRYYDLYDITDTEHGGAEYFADYLLANGVIVPPCKVGDTVWFIRGEKIIETKVDKVVLKYGGLYLQLHCNSVYETTCRSIGKTVFLTKEEAERALKGGEG